MKLNKQKIQKQTAMEICEFVLQWEKEGWGYNTLLRKINEVYIIGK